ncbi:hypothetical protein OESDEN_09869 [Oesophagostomum dentatum]|uniref:DUF4139 domain-containing protein n=1 Tax=Oesophagostomum dentatum TaxID=61180 RepID=A0A0B1SZ80_OESDE|nr:hypothetical protein OESDEN_09869 [Oesophagostomum dentatum]
MSEENSPFVLKKECRDQKLERVVVFNDRAELKRLVECDLKAGMNEIHVEIIYYGNISQSTQEDWSDATLVLSTAQPSSGGQVPELGTLEAIFYRPPPPPPPPMMGVRHYKRAKRVVEDSIEPCSLDLEEEEEGDELEAPMAVGMAAAAPAEPYALSTEFTIAKPAAIPSDGAEHKVTIGIIDVEPLLVHECVPSKNKSAFLTASAVNSSELAFLPGDASVYLNNSFISKTFLKNISPGERFSCSLGVDTALRVEYKPARKYHEQTGLLTKSSSTVNDQLIIVKNSRGDPVLLTVKEPIPRSTDEKIRVGCLRAF